MLDVGGLRQNKRRLEEQQNFVASKHFSGYFKEMRQVLEL